MSSSHDNTNITRQLKSKRDDFLLGLGLVDQMLASYKEILTNAGVRLAFPPPYPLYCPIALVNPILTSISRTTTHLKRQFTSCRSTERAFN